MEVTEWTVYWVTRLDALDGAAFTGIVLISVLYPAFLLCGAMAADLHGWDGYARTVRRTWIPALLIFLLLGGVRVATPTTKEACAILVIPAIVETDGVQELPGEFVTLAREWMQELRPGRAE